MNLNKFLNKKPLYYTKFDPKRVHRVFNRIKHHFDIPKTIHIVGTNGKGSTGRFLAEFLTKRGKKVFHYTSPHILQINERFWLNGKNIDDEKLDSYHKKLKKLLTKKEAKELSYFEYTTLLAAFISKETEFFVCEAGLGGEYDATSIFEPVLLLVTKIAKDHQLFLGKNIKQIAKTKLNVAKSPMIVGAQDKKIVCKIAKQKSIDVQCISKIDQDFISQNRLLAYYGAKFLGFNPKLKEFKTKAIFGRWSKYKKNIILDVGHNPLAAKAAKKKLKGKKVFLIYNTFEDKKYQKILKILKPNIKKVFILKIKDKRALNKEELKKSLNKLMIPFDDFNFDFNKKSKYLVFGSFKVIEEFIRKINER